MNLDVQYGGGHAGTILWVYNTNNMPSQMFLWVPVVDEGGYSIIMVLTGPMMLDAAANSVVLNPWSGADTMKWRRVPVNSGYLIQNQTGSYLCVASAQSQTPITLTNSTETAAVWQNS